MGVALWRPVPRWGWKPKIKGKGELTDIPVRLGPWLATGSKGKKKPDNIPAWYICGEWESRLELRLSSLQEEHLVQCPRINMAMLFEDKKNKKFKLPKAKNKFQVPASKETN